MFFGAIMLTLSVSAIIYDGIRNSSQNMERKEAAIKQNRDWYTDHKGKTRYIKNDKLVFLTTVKINGSEHKVLKYPGTNIIISDYTQQHFDQASKDSYKLAKKIGASVYLYEDCSLNSNEDEFSGHKVKDIETGDIYVIRDFESKYGFVSYYVDIKTGKIIRPTDYFVLLIMYIKKHNSRYRECPIVTKSIDFFIKYRNEGVENEITKNLVGYGISKGSYEFSSESYDMTMELFKKCNINKIYEDGETWENKKNEYIDVGCMYKSLQLK